ncbi:MAG: Exopolyphosphatase [Candidatus Tokpelaia hoelldobleri]|uniref:Exopolyphosphatase n=1 Tax=Candidatus Tokpelaia hoelldobleri TaxID=1902579 RepID=A0A1U9JVF6_9HYPH|nr:MAG: Exopolyphosphatase [Candidatus Tokpelaia hoelldoblerii]
MPERFGKMTPSNTGPRGYVRGSLDEKVYDAAVLHIGQESDCTGDIVSSHGVGCPVKQKKRRLTAARCEEAAVTQKTGSLARTQGKNMYKGKRQKAVKPGKASHSGGLYAALDLGTNNCRLLIARPTRPGYFRVVDGFSRIVRLGEGLSRTKRLSSEAMGRAIAALKICRERLEQADISHQRLIATEACRLADNGAEFIERVRKETGLQLEVVDRETEARLAVSGCGTLVEQETEAVVLFDIGGGSSEIALIDVSKYRSPRLAEHIIAWTSLPVGVVTLAERFGGEIVTQDNFFKMKAYVTGLLEQFAGRDKLDHLARGPNFHLLGTSGTVTTLAGIHLKLDRYDRRRVDGMWLDSTDITRMTDVLLSWDMQQRLANPCIGEGRADLVLAGCAILEAIRALWPQSRLRVADRGLREGILTELMSRAGAWRRPRYGARRAYNNTPARQRRNEKNR